MHIAVEGCGHGELDGIYAAVRQVERSRNITVDLLIICGDFQATRNPDDLQCMAVPPKYYTMGTFYKYYSGELKAPILTLVIGGNHEASNYMQELAYGGWLAPNIYFVGYASVLRFGDLRIAALSGIYNGHDYLKGHHERPPYDKSTMRTAYHVRNMETFRLKQLSPDIDIFVSHDWPRGVYHHGNLEQLLRVKPFFRDEVVTNKLGSRPSEELLKTLKPRFWFAAHLHVKFSALVRHEPDTEQKDSGSGAAVEPARTTRFLALDKCLPRRKFLQVLELGSDGDPELTYDLEWLTVLRLTDHLTSVSSGTQYMPGPGCKQRYDFRPSADELSDTSALWGSDLRVPYNFSATVAPYDGRSNIRAGRQPAAVTNPQTNEFCRRLKIRDPMALLVSGVPPPDTAGPLTQFSGDQLECDVTLDPDTSLDLDQTLGLTEVSLDGSEQDLSLGDDDLFVIDRRGSTGSPRRGGSAGFARSNRSPAFQPGVFTRSPGHPRGRGASGFQRPAGSPRPSGPLGSSGPSGPYSPVTASKLTLSSPVGSSAPGKLTLPAPSATPVVAKPTLSLPPPQAAENPTKPGLPLPAPKLTETPARLGLSLPPPRNTAVKSVLPPDSVSFPDIREDKSGGLDTPVEGAGPRQVKRFKRRNQSLYAEDNSED